ncbi:MAG: ATP phosphoribosyltransferase regulatory subunit, partial [Chloroflexi bacterium]|nr:ATP phosphoribosyltransferase regulatory subunit [Chloroflexota bacterium]
QPFTAAAPQSANHLCDPCRAHWDILRGYLNGIGLEFDVDHRLVRGLDYYSRTVFEISPPDEGRTATLVGGGRYDGLIESLGGKSTPGIGFGMGLERVIGNLKQQEVLIPEPERASVLVAHLGDPAKAEAVRLASELRRAGITSVLSPSRGLRSQLRYANAKNCTHAVIIGDDELAKGVAVVRDLRHSEQKEVPFDALVASLSDV